MYVSRVFLRFYKAFNFDYLRRADPTAKPDPWEMVGEVWHPYVRVPLDRELTAVVGANESGKSQLLDALRVVLTRGETSIADFCRYSPLFAVEAGEMRLPDLGVELRGFSQLEASAIRDVLVVAPKVEIEPLHLFVESGSDIAAYVGPAHDRQALDDATADKLFVLLPVATTIQANVPLPDAVPIEYLIDPSGHRPVDRRQLRAVTDAYQANPDWFKTTETLQAAAASLVGLLPKVETEEDKIAGESVRLAHELVVDIAKVDKAALRALGQAVLDGNDGTAAGLVSKINEAIAARLNLSHWWTQDPDFRLVVSMRTRELVFTIQDRTAAEYSFRERSVGLKYFLSYLVQFLSHEAPAAGRNELLLMDEPDAFLSSRGQQDLVRVLEEFASPKTVSRPPAQVVYVTHSPFLINRNYAQRVRVLDKGAGEEGTRLVRDASQNHYEPLRSSFGSLLGETTLMGSANLVVEGTSDQVLLAGISRRLREQGRAPSDILDLNRVTIVPAGGADQIPYLVYLARGRDTEKPSVVVLLDSDSEGDKVVRVLRKKPVNRGELISKEFVVRVGSVTIEGVSDSPRQIEDLIPDDVAAAAARRHAKTFGARAGQVEQVTAVAVAAERASSDGTFTATERVYQTAVGVDSLLDKIGFARAVLEVLADPPEGVRPEIAEERFAKLIAVLSSKLREAERLATHERVDRLVDRIKRRFLDNNPRRATRNDARLLLESSITRSETPSRRRTYARASESSSRSTNLTSTRLRTFPTTSRSVRTLRRLRWLRD